jgi:hypothetical protein
LAITWADAEIRLRRRKRDVHDGHVQRDHQLHPNENGERPPPPLIVPAGYSAGVRCLWNSYHRTIVIYERRIADVRSARVGRLSSQTSVYAIASNSRNSLGSERAHAIRPLDDQLDR